MIAKNKPRFIAVYDFQVNPASYDVIHFCAMLNGALGDIQDSGLDIVILGDSNNSIWEGRNEIYDARDNQWRFRQIALPAFASFFPRANLLFFHHREEGRDYALKSNFPPEYNYDEPQPYYGDEIYFRETGPCYRPLKYEGKALDYVEAWFAHYIGSRKLITITLREHPHIPDRNSDVAAWKAFINELDHERYCCVILRDTCKALYSSEFSDASIEFPIGSFNLEMRLAIYERSYLSLITNNGPGAYLYSCKTVPYLYYKPIFTSSGGYSNIESMVEKYKVFPGMNWKDAQLEQVFVWENDRSDTIKRSFIQLVKRMEGDCALSCHEMLRLADDALSENDLEAAWDWSAIAVGFYQNEEIAWLQRVKILMNTGRGLEAFYQAQYACKKFNSHELRQISIDYIRHLEDPNIYYRYFNQLILPSLNIEISSLEGNDNATKLHLEQGSVLFIFGASVAGKIVYERINNDYHCLGFIDNDPQKQGHKHCGLTVLSVEDYLKEEKQVPILLASSSFGEIYYQLSEIGIDPSLIRISPPNWFV